MKIKGIAKRIKDVDFNKLADIVKESDIKQGLFCVFLLLSIVLIITHSYCFYRFEHYVNGEKFKPIGEEARQEKIMFLESNPDYVMSDLETYEVGWNTRNLVKVDDEMHIETDFTSKASYLTAVRLRFSNPDPGTADGEVFVSVKDKKGNILGETSLEIDRINNRAMTDFSFLGDTKYINGNRILDFNYEKTDEKGIRAKREPLTLVVDIKVQNGKFGVFLSNDMPYKEGLPQIYFVQKGKNILYSHLLMNTILVLACIYFVLISKHIDAFKSNKALLVMTALTPAFCTFFLRLVSGTIVKYSIRFVFLPLGLLNIILIGFFLCLFYVIIRRKKIAVTLTIAICAVLGAANYALFQFRDSPLMASDLASIGTAMQVAGTYSVVLDRYAVLPITYITCWLCVTWSMKEVNKRISTRKYIRDISVVALCGIILFSVFYETSFLRDYNIRISSFKSKETYRKNGYMLSFFVSTTLLKVDKPAGYSAAKVKKLTEEYVSDTITKNAGVSESNPNIIFVMNEAFSDLRENGQIPMNQEYMPFSTVLEENTVKGKAYTTAYAGQTAASEFEILTGFTLRFLPFSSIPYTSLLKEDTPNYTTSRRDDGYGGLIAFHPGVKTSYNRDNAYPLLGFNKYVSIEDLEKPKKLRAYLSDESDYEIVEKMYEEHEDSKDSESPFYIFNVTIQNHGGYDNADGIVDAGIELTNPAIQSPGLKNYLNLMKLSDVALKGLIDYFENVDEPTVIVLVGDHQPNLNQSVLDAIYEISKTQDLDDKIKHLNKYAVPFMIWANYDIPSKEGEIISLNYLSSYVQQTIGGKMTGFNKYLMGLHETLPAISGQVLMDKDGKCYSIDEKTPYDDLLKEYQMIQYNGFVDRKNRLNDFFYLNSAE